MLCIWIVLICGNRDWLLLNVILAYFSNMHVETILRQFRQRPFAVFGKSMDSWVVYRLSSDYYFTKSIKGVITTGAKYENGVAYLLSYTVSVEKLYCQLKKKRMIMKILKKEWFIWKFWKKGGVVQKRGGGNEIHAPVIFKENGKSEAVFQHFWSARRKLFFERGVTQIRSLFFIAKLIICLVWIKKIA